MEPNVATFSLDNDRDEMFALHGEDFLSVTLTPVDFPDRMTVGEFWEHNLQGTYMLLTPSKKQPENGASVHITILPNGVIRNVTPTLLKKRLFGAQEVVGHGSAD